MTALEKIKNTIVSTLAAPVPARVDKSYIKPSSGGYCFDGEILLPGTLKATGELLKEVSISPVWAGKDGRGIYCPPEKGQVVVVSFIGFNKAYPFYSGVWGDAYTPAGGDSGKFVIADGQGGIFSMEGMGLFSLMNSSKSLKQLLENIIDSVAGLRTIGPPPQHVVDPSQIADLTVLKTTVGLLFKE